ncbi:MAG: alpha-L-fucosidase [Bacteroidales bacterium]|nr:alpha-L-fucosidase [Bacteroidales bacterium]
MRRSKDKIRRIVLLVICIIAVNDMYSQKKDDLLKDWTDMHNTKTDVFKDYNDLKFGMFIHWGVYSKLGGVWKGEKIIPETRNPKYGASPESWLQGEWIMFCAGIRRQEYRDVARTFNPSLFDAEKWVMLAKEAGMRYIVAMPKHHDGFAMYHSEVNDFNIYDWTPFKRDPIEEIYKACQKYGLRMGIYYSHSIDWMDGGDAGEAQYRNEHPGYIDNYAINHFDPSPVKFTEYIEKKAKPQMREILKKFPNLVEIWYDYPRNMNLEQSFDFYKLAYDIQPNCLVNSRIGNDLGDFLNAGDNEIPTDIDSKYKTWETPGTLNNTWGYKSYDNDWKSLDEMLFWIVEIASKGGNYLLNVGPDGDGVIPPGSVKVLKEIGAWMKVNGEAIYGTSKWITKKEGPTKPEMKSTSARKENGFNSSFTAQDFWFTAKGNNVYVISLADHVGEKITVKSLYECRQKIKSIKILGNNESLKWEASDNKITVFLPIASITSLPGFVFKVELK